MSKPKVMIADVGNFDLDMMPSGTIIKYWLRAVLDGFDEICRRMEKAKAEPE